MTIDEAVERVLSAIKKTRVVLVLPGTGVSVESQDDFLDVRRLFVREVILFAAREVTPEQGGVEMPRTEAVANVMYEVNEYGIAFGEGTTDESRRPGITAAWDRVEAAVAALAEQGLVVVRRDDLTVLRDQADRGVRHYHPDVLDRVAVALAEPGDGGEDEG